MSDFITKQNNLHYRLMQKMNEDNVETTSEIASFLDVSKAVEEELSPYTKAIFGNESKFLNKINKRNRVFKSFPKASKITSKVNKDGISTITIIFETREKIVLTASNEIGTDYYISYSDFDIDKSRQFVFKDDEIYRYIFLQLFNFKSKYPNTEFEFAKKTWNFSNELRDGFISFSINLSDPSYRVPYFTYEDDHMVSIFHSRKFGKLEDYLYQCSDLILSKCSVDRSKLDPLTNTMLDNYLESKKEHTRNLEKNN